MKEKTIDIGKRRKRRVHGFRVVEDECIWMKAGVVNFRLCDNVYDCYSCPFDKGMQRTLSSGPRAEAPEEGPGWVERLKERYHGAERPCRHALTGRIDAPKICPMNYECYHCTFDQMIDELDFTQPDDPPAYTSVSGYKTAGGCYYHAGHSWVRFEHGGRIRVGFDDFAVKLFGAFDFLALPPLGAVLKKDQVGLTFGRGPHKAASLSPASGTVLAVNHKVREHPQIVQEDPYHLGWLYILEPDMAKRNLKGLYYGKESMQWLEHEIQKLLNLLGPEYERLAATGAKPVSDVFGRFPWIGWAKLAKTFLGTEKT